ncbi:pectin lyase fold/virulence factor [Mycena maculata]|uniref:pectinesterase n=1 Tax=Mycena maculata TaxID=230809 RepID=A0AAD7KAB5_9AGAR|nr:pectin lyase fold/virulence factor [Mycena maculata]
MAHPYFVVLTVAIAWAASASVTSFAKYAACQATAKPKSLPTLFCPEGEVYLISRTPFLNPSSGTLYVSQKDSSAHFTSVQATIASLPNDTSPGFILIDAGTYQEAVNITRKGPTRLLGRTDHPASCRFSVENLLYSTRLISNILLRLGKDTTEQLRSRYLMFLMNIHQEFGCTDFKAYNINFENRANNGGVGPALAFGIDFAHASFYASTFRGMQDTMFVGKNGSAVFQKSQVLGSVDYIYGFGTAYFGQNLMGTRGYEGQSV